MIRPLAVHTYQRPLFGEPFEPGKRGGFRYPPVVRFFQQQPAGKLVLHFGKEHILVRRAPALDNGGGQKRKNMGGVQIKRLHQGKHGMKIIVCNHHVPAWDDTVLQIIGRNMRVRFHQRRIFQASQDGDYRHHAARIDGMNLAVRNVTGKDPDAYLSDYRNRNNARMQEVKEAIGIESRTTIFNPAYIKEKMKGEAGAANTFAEIVQNTYGWNVMKPQAVDKEMWNEIYDVYVKDKFNLGVQGYFEKQNPAALEEMTAVMMETIRKGMWQASEQQIADIAKLHTDLVNKYKPSCSGFVCDNAKLRQFIASKMDAQTASRYKENISQIREVAASKEQKGMVMKKEEMNTVGTEQQTNTVSNTVVCVVVVAAVLVLIVLVRCRRKKMQE